MFFLTAKDVFVVFVQSCLLMRTVAANLLMIFFYCLSCSALMHYSLESSELKLFSLFMPKNCV